MIRLRCPHCNCKVRAPDTLAGQRGRCPDCHGVVPLPAAGEAADRVTDDVADGAAAISQPADEQPLPSIAFAVDDLGTTATVVADHAGAEAGLSFRPPTMLRRHCHYLICNSKDVVARWDDDGKGWMVQVKDGFVKAVSNPTQLPTMGNYVFVEIEIVSDGPKQRLNGVHAFSLPGAFALTKLARHENAILEALERTAELNDRQKALVRQRINAKYLPSIWEEAAEF